MWSRTRTMGATALVAFVVAVGLYSFAARQYVGDTNDASRSIAMDVAGILLSGVVVGMVVGWLARRIDAAVGEQQFRRGLVRETLDAHALVKAAAIRVTTYRSIRAYNEAIRDLAIPARAVLGGVASEIRADPSLQQDDELDESVRSCLAFLDMLVDEFSDGYLTASRLQEVAERNRKKALPSNITFTELEAVLDPDQRQEALRSDIAWLRVDNPAWDYLMSGRFPALSVLQSHAEDRGQYVTEFSAHIQKVLRRLGVN